MKSLAGVTLAVAVAGCSEKTFERAPLPPCTPPPPPLSGEATFYAADGTGACSFAASDGPPMVAALNRRDYQEAAWCGACIEVTGPDGTVTVQVVDSCPGCGEGGVDLSREAFARIAPVERGRVKVTWRVVGCETQGPVRYHFKDGSTGFWTALQVRNHRYPIRSLQARKDNEWRELGRRRYNYFVADKGLGAGPYAIRITDERGHVLEDTVAAAHDDRAGVAGARQAPRCDAP